MSYSTGFPPVSAIVVGAAVACSHPTDTAIPPSARTPRVHAGAKNGGRYAHRGLACGTAAQGLNVGTSCQHGARARGREAGCPAQHADAGSAHARVGKEREDDGRLPISITCRRRH